MQVNFNTGAKAPRLPCVSPNCKICDSHSNLKKVTEAEHLEMPQSRPVLTWLNDLPSNVLPHFAYSVTPPRIY